MTRSEDAKEPTAATAATAQTEQPGSGRKQFDPSRYQVSTFPAEVRSEYQKLPLHKFSEEELKPPPGYGHTPAAHGVQAVVAKLQQQRIPIAVGLLLALALVTWLSLRPALVQPEPATIAAAARDNTAAAPTISAAAGDTPATAPNSDNAAATPSAALAPIAANPRRTRPPTPPIALTPVAPRPKTTAPSKPPPEKVINVPLIDR